MSTEGGGATIAEISRWPDKSPLQFPLVGKVSWVFDAQENERGRSQGFKVETGEMGAGGKPLALTCNLMATEHDPNLPDLQKGMSVTIQARYAEAAGKRPAGWVGVTKGTANAGKPNAYPKLNIYGASHLRFAADEPYPAGLALPGEPNYLSQPPGPTGGYHDDPGPASAPPPEYGAPPAGSYNASFPQPAPPATVPAAGPLAVPRQQTPPAGQARAAWNQSTAQPPALAGQSKPSHSHKLSEAGAREVWKRNFENGCRFFGWDVDQRLAADMPPHVFDVVARFATTILIAVQDGKVEEAV